MTSTKPKIIIDHAEVLQLRASGLSFGEIAKKFKANRGTIAGMIWRNKHPGRASGSASHYLPKPKMEIIKKQQLPDRFYHVAWD